jgi:hypothetical protein
MDIDTVSLKYRNTLEQQIMQIAKLLYHSVYDILQEFDLELAIARRNRYYKDNSEYSGY